MSIPRRDWLRAAAASGTAALLGSALGGCAASSGSEPRAPRRAARKILILGGTGFLGPATVEAALARGHTVTLFHRGRTRPGLFPGVEKLHGDRDPKKGDGLRALVGRGWDAVIDNSGYYPRIVAASAELLAGSTSQYIYISSTGAYREPYPVGGDENAPLATLADPTVETMGADFANYGGLKVLCEQAAARAMAGRVTVVRPGYIVGPDDPTGRFTYWPVRCARGGAIAAPGTPADPIQIIDVRDLGPWLVKLVEDGTLGTFNACGPEAPLTWGQLLDLCVEASQGQGKLVWIPADLVGQDKEVEFPIWAPAQGGTKGFHTWNCARAIQAGLRFRPAAQTVKDTLAWYRAQEADPNGRKKLAGPTPEQEARLIERARAAAATSG